MASALCLVAPASARADCPGIFSTGTPYFTTCNGVCGTVSASELSCDLDQGGGSDASGSFVSPSATTFRAYGYDDTGAKYCCELGPLDDGFATDEIDVLINGTRGQ